MFTIENTIQTILENIGKIETISSFTHNHNIGYS